MANYVKATNFYTKDALLTGNPAKIIKGAEIDAEYNAIATAVNSKADTTSPTFTGTPTAPTAAAGSNTTQLATTAFVTAVTDTLGTIATQDANAVNITGGTISAASISSTGTIFAGLNTAADANIEIGSGRTVAGNTYIDFHSAVPSGLGGDYDFRILRTAGTNENAFIHNNGTGGMIFTTNGTTRLTIDSAGITGNLAPNFTGSNQSTGASGYQKFPGGLIMQWGSVSITGYNSFAVTYPTAFTTATRNIQFTIQGGSQGNTEGALSANTISTTGFTITTSMSGSFPVYWLAIGY